MNRRSFMQLLAAVLPATCIKWLGSGEQVAETPLEWFDYELEPFTYATPPQQDAMSGFEKFVVTPLDEVEPRALTMEDIDNAWEFLKNQPSRPNLWHESD